ncbi:MAG TPA: hypothetical protein VFN46_10905 [Acetobacteraceae bacterium]|nr:hypothetical protein [Acetobacteraceae bacterium]
MRIMRADPKTSEIATPDHEAHAHPTPSEAQIDAWAAEDDSEWTADDFARAQWRYPPPEASELRATRTRLGLTEAQFAARFGFSAEEIRGYERGVIPSGHAATLLRIVVADPEGAARALSRPPAT